MIIHLYKNIDYIFLLFIVKNTITSIIEKKKENKTGIRTEKIKRRLELLFKDKFDLNTLTKKNIFSVKVKTLILN